MTKRILPTVVVFAMLISWNQNVDGHVIPMMGGGQIGMAGAPMKHLDITFDGSAVKVHVDDSTDAPLLRPLTPPDTFDAAQPWNVLQEKAYNFQYGWNAGGFMTLPPGTGIWIANVTSSPELEVYQRPPADPAYAPILGTDGSSAEWQWVGSMTHNVYAVLNPVQSTYTAKYKVYIGDAISGAEIAGYDSDQVTLTLNAIPVPEPAAWAMSMIGMATLACRRHRSVH